ncbi:MAG: hypothetical protein LBS85_04940 [Clostridiales Family XIII bacterium]|nr:hypothetical protein [Clostridiales Family XIII bacterium]
MGLFDRFRKAEAGAADDGVLCFAARTEKFWVWFSEHEGEIDDFLAHQSEYDAEKAETFVAFLSEGVGLISEDIHFNIGGEHEFTFTISGDSYLFFLLPYIISRMPGQYREKWRFFAGMPGSDGANFGFQMSDIDTDFEHIFVSCKPSETEKKADVRFWSQAFDDADDERAYGFFYIAMENAIGETLAYVGIESAERADSLEEDMVPLTQFGEKLRALVLEDGEGPDPVSRYFVYQIDAKGGDTRAADVFIGTGNFSRIIDAYYGGDAKAFGEFSDCGAIPVFLYYRLDAACANPIEERNAITDRLLLDVLGEQGSGLESGLLFGSAMGRKHAYIDLLLFDRERFAEKAKAALVDYPYTFFLSEFKPGGKTEELCQGTGQARALGAAGGPAADDIAEGTAADAGTGGRAELLRTLNELHANGKYTDIVRTIEQIPPNEWDYELTNHLARAYNNLEDYQKALALLESVAEAGKDDAKWHFRVGYAYIYMNQGEKAVPYFEKAIELGDDGEDSVYLLNESKRVAALKKGRDGGPILH